MVALLERPPVGHRRTTYRRLYHLHTAVLQAALNRYRENRLTGEQFATVLIVFGSRFANAPNGAEQMTVCRRFLRVLKGDPHDRN